MLGDRLVSAREQKGMKQVDLAEALGVSKTCINYWEKDKREPSVKDIKHVCSILDINADDLLGIHSAPADQEQNEEQTLISDYRKASKEDRSALLRFAYYASRAAIEPSREELEAEALRARDYLIEQSRSQSDSLEAAK